ncbi:hypothetical protein COO60DRAFT_1699203 [Scenedesmus sp. NREL 46B-D3]|nr:hypothetical protein COO60DRAFT_1699203 [Scenedesmus sp. NREL 46B-D3]
MLQWAAQTQIRTCSRSFGVATTTTAQQQQHRHHQLSRRWQQARKQRTQAQVDESGEWNEIFQKAHDSNTGGVPDDAPSMVAAVVDTEGVLQQLNSLKSKLDAAVAQEDYTTAQQLKQMADALKQQLPPVQQYMLAQVAKLGSSNPADRRAAVSALGEVGDASCLPELASCLHERDLNTAACDAMWAVFHRHPNPAVNRLMDQGLGLLQPGSPLVKFRAALEAFDEACKLEPSFAEAHNKRATVLFLMHRYEESIEVCELVLQLNPHHFGAANGMGMCHLQLENHTAALAAFERALAINPAMEPIQTYVAALKAKLADDGLGRPEGL